MLNNVFIFFGNFLTLLSVVFFFVNITKEVIHSNCCNHGLSSTGHHHGHIELQ